MTLIPKPTPKQVAFVREYLVDLNAAHAAIRAGYSERSAKQTAHDLLAKPHVQAAIQAGMDKRAQRVELTADDVLRNLLEINQRCMQRDPVFIGKGKDRKHLTQIITATDGEEVLAQVFQFDAQGALRANELIGKHLKMFTDKVEHSGTVQVVATPLDERL